MSTCISKRGEFGSHEFVRSGDTVVCEDCGYLTDAVPEPRSTPGPSTGTPEPSRAASEAQADAWDKGYASGFSNAMRRMSDEPQAPTTSNPFRAVLASVDAPTPDEHADCLHLDQEVFDAYQDVTLAALDATAQLDSREPHTPLGRLHSRLMELQRRIDQSIAHRSAVLREKGALR